MTLSRDCETERIDDDDDDDNLRNDFYLFFDVVVEGRKEYKITGEGFIIWKVVDENGIGKSTKGRGRSEDVRSAKLLLWRQQRLCNQLNVRQM